MVSPTALTWALSLDILFNKINTFLIFLKKKKTLTSPTYPCPANVTYCQTFLPLLENQTIVQQPVSLETLELGYAAKAVEFILQNQYKPFFLYVFLIPIFLCYFTSFLIYSMQGTWHSITHIQHFKDNGVQTNSITLPSVDYIFNSS